MPGTRKHIPINAAPPGPAGAGPAFAAAAGPSEPAHAAGQAQLETEVEALRKERDLLTERELRLRAEFENFRRRASREAVEARERAQGELLGDMLPVFDNLERALDAAEHHDEG